MVLTHKQIALVRFLFISLSEAFACEAIEEASMKLE